VAELLPYAKAVSAKSYNFNEQGEDTKIDYFKMMKIVKDSAYNGYIGIEYEGMEKSEHEGIEITRELMKRAWNKA
jgi:hydroxypyruvate isomerase